MGYIPKSYCDITQENSVTKGNHVPTNMNASNVTGSIQLTPVVKNHVATEMAPKALVMLKKNLLTPFAAIALANWLDGYDAETKAFLIHGFTKGVLVQYRGTSQCEVTKNSKIAREIAGELWSMEGSSPLMLQ